jgi:hypothetical protein
MIDILCLAVIAAVVYFVSNEGTWGALHTLLCVLFSALIATNFFEQVAAVLDGVLPQYRHFMDVTALVGLFIASVFALRMGSEHLVQLYIQLPSSIDLGGKWLFSAATGYLTMAFLLMALHTAPLPREFLGFKPERNNFFGMAPDRQWLGFMQHVTEKPYGWFVFLDTDTKQMVPHAFDGKYERLGDKTSSFPNTIWPSFPIRYASLRQRLEGNQPVANRPAARPQPAPRPQQSGAPAPTGNVGF